MSRWMVFLLILPFFLIGCSGGAQKGKQVEVDLVGGTPIEGELKVALLTPGPVSDAGWSAMAYRGLEAIQREVGADTAHVEATDSSMKDNMRRFAQDGYHLVIGHGFEYNEPGVEVSKDFPKTVFVSSSGGETSTNAGAFRFYLEQGFYVAGYMAGMMTKSNIVAMIGGPEYPSIRSTFKAFKAGAEEAKPSIIVKEVFTGAESDGALAKQATEQAIRDGADFIIHQANAGASGVFEACAEKNVYCFGANLDQNSDGKTVIASAIINAEPAFVELAKEVKAGTYKGQVQLMGMEQGAIQFVLNPELMGEIPEDVKKAIDELQLKIIIGNKEIPKDNF